MNRKFWKFLSLCVHTNSSCESKQIFMHWPLVYGPAKGIYCALLDILVKSGILHVTLIGHNICTNQYCELNRKTHYCVTSTDATKKVEQAHQNKQKAQEAYSRVSAVVLYTSHWVNIYPPLQKSIAHALGSDNLHVKVAKELWKMPEMKRKYFK